MVNGRPVYASPSSSSETSSSLAAYPLQGTVDAVEYSECSSGGFQLLPALLLQVVFLGVHRLHDLLQCWWSARMAIHQPGCVLTLLTETVAVAVGFDPTTVQSKAKEPGWFRITASLVRVGAS